jgi:hypothetical protein
MEEEGVEGEGSNAILMDTNPFPSTCWNESWFIAHEYIGSPITGAAKVPMATDTSLVTPPLLKVVQNPAG